MSLWWVEGIWKSDAAALQNLYIQQELSSREYCFSNELYAVCIYNRHRTQIFLFRNGNSWFVWIYKNEKGVDNTFCFTIGFYDADRKHNTLTHTLLLFCEYTHTYRPHLIIIYSYTAHILYMYVFTCSTYTIKECNNTHLH